MTENTNTPALRMEGVRKTYEVGAAIAVTCFVDHTPPPPPKEESAFMPRRDRGAGRPTKRDRRALDRLRRR